MSVRGRPSHHEVGLFSAFRWLRLGFAWFDASWGTWLLLMVLTLPVLGLIARTQIGSVIVVGLSLGLAGVCFAGADGIRRGEGLSLGAAFGRARSASFFWVQIVTIVTQLLVAVLLLVYLGVGAQGFGSGALPPGLLANPWVIVLFTWVSCLFGSMTTFAAVAVVVDDQSASTGLSLGLRLTLSHIVPLTLFWILLCALLLLGLLACLIGTLVALPVLYTAYYAAYRDMVPSEDVSDVF